MRLSRLIAWRVLVMFIVHVRMLMLHRLVNVEMLVTLRWFLEPETALSVAEARARAGERQQRRMLTQLRGGAGRRMGRERSRRTFAGRDNGAKGERAMSARRYSLTRPRASRSCAIRAALRLLLSP